MKKIAWYVTLLALFTVLIFRITEGKLNAENVTETLANYIDPATGMEFIFVKGGCFMMGDIFGDGEADEKPVHEVCLSDFYMGKYEVTQEQWTKVMGTNPSANVSCGERCPVDSVSWTDIQRFIEKLNKLSGEKYRLPTEAEWEYAARSGGLEEKWSGTNDEKNIGDYMWFNDNAETRVHRVGLKRPNALGLHDMSGNVTEWCLDWYDARYYKRSPKNNPYGPETGERRVLRGGSLEDKVSTRTVKRHHDTPDVRDGNYGFRIIKPIR